jgi:hypothetical protein
MEALTGIFSAFGLSASAGLNAYIPLLVVALLARYTNLIKLSPPWDTLTSGWVIGLLVVLLAIEFFADKVPAVNHINDILQTFVRPAAGAIVFAASTSVIEMNTVFAMAMGLLVAGSVHAVKATARPVVTVSTGGTGNALMSLAEDTVSTVVSVVSIVWPYVAAFFVLLGFFLITLWLIRRSRKRANEES